MTHYTIALIGQAPRTVEAANLGEALSQLGIAPENMTFRANGSTVTLDYTSSEPVTVVAAKNLVGA